MGISANTSTIRPRNPLLLLLGGCALVTVCLLLGCGALVAYRFSPLSRTSADLPPSLGAMQNDWAALPVGNTAAGEQLYNSRGTCIGCHSLDHTPSIEGPSLSGIGASAATRRPGYSAPLFLYESIVYPRAYVVPGNLDGIMPTDYKSRLSQQQIADLIAFLMTK